MASVSISQLGPLFEQPDRIVNYHINVMTSKLADEAEMAVKFQGQSSFRYVAAPPTGEWARSVKSRVAAAIGELKAYEVHDSGIVYGPWLEGVGSRNAPVTRFAGYSMFRKVAQQIERKAPDMLLPEINKLTKDLGGN
jgi:hypothetical protein